MVMTKRRNASGVRLTDRDLVVLEHVANYGISVTEVLNQLPCFYGGSINAAHTVRRRLLKGGYLGWQELGHEQYRNCYYLAAKAREVIAVPANRVGRLADEPRVRAFAVLAFCCLGKVKRERLTKEEFAEVFPDLYEPQRRVNYYVDSEGDKQRLSYIRVDFGRSETVPLDRLVSYCRRDMDRNLSNPAAVSMAEQDALQLTVLTAMPQKAKMFRLALDDLRLNRQPLPLPVRVVHLPELRELVAPIKR